MAKNTLWQNMKINSIMQTPNNIKTYIKPIIAPEMGATAPLFGANIGLMYVFRLLGVLHGVDFDTLQQPICDHPFCNLKGWLGII